MSDQPDDKLWTLDEACIRIAGPGRVSRRTLERERRRGHLRFTKIGHLSFIREGEILRYLRAQEERERSRAA
jgi:hypothetical protein